MKRARFFPLLQVIFIGGLTLLTQRGIAQQTDASGDEYINPDRPGIADGSKAVGRGRFQVESGFQQEFRRTADGHSQTQFLPTLLRLGLNRDFELRFESNSYTRMLDHSGGSNTMSSDGLAPFSLGLKYHFVEGDQRRRPSLGAILRVFPPSGTGDFPLSLTTGDLRLAADWDFAPQWSLNPNLGVAVSEDAKGSLYNAITSAITLNYNPSKTLNFFLDAGLQSPEAKHGETAMIVDAGIAYIIGKDIQLDLSAGSGVLGETPPKPFIAVGVSKRF